MNTTPNTFPHSARMTFALLHPGRSLPNLEELLANACVATTQAELVIVSSHATLDEIDLEDALVGSWATFADDNNVRITVTSEHSRVLHRTLPLNSTPCVELGVTLFTREHFEQAGTEAWWDIFSRYISGDHQWDSQPETILRRGVTLSNRTSTATHVTVVRGDEQWSFKLRA